MVFFKTSVKILGTKWDILVYDNYSYIARFGEDSAGETDTNTKIIAIKDIDNIFGYFTKQAIRHEVTHAFQWESGIWTAMGDGSLDCEATTDWIARHCGAIELASLEIAKRYMEYKDGETGGTKQPFWKRRKSNS